MFKTIDLNRLKISYNIYNCNSVNGAAKELCFTPSAISKNVAKLEAEIKARLFI